MMTKDYRQVPIFSIKKLSPILIIAAIPWSLIAIAIYKLLVE
jgi:hypothetical protein